VSTHHLTRLLQRALPLPAGAPLPTILHALSRASAEDEIGITLLNEDVGQEETRSYAEIAAGAWRRAAQLRALGVAVDERVLLVLPTGFDFIEAFLGLQLAGAVPVPAYPPPALQQAEVALNRLRHIVADAEIRVCLTDRTLAPLMGALGGFGRQSVSRVVAVEQLPEADVEAFEPTVGDVAFFQYTSGSTGRPKGVVVTQAAAMHNIYAAGLASEVTREDRMVSWLPLYHDMGLIGGLLWPIYWRIPLVLMSPMTFLRAPERWLQAMSDYRGTLTMAPNFAYARCVKRIRGDVRANLDLSSWRVALNGAEPVNSATVNAFNEAFGPCGLNTGVIYPCYGLAESVVAVTFPTPGEEVSFERLDREALSRGEVSRSNAEHALEVACVGSALPGHFVGIADESGDLVADRTIGEIVVSGPSLMRGYHGNPQATADTIREGRLHTGDLGFMDAGKLYITGRAKDLIIVRGKNVHAEDVETIVEETPGVRRGRVVAFGVYDEVRASDRVVVVVEGGPTDDVLRDSMSAEIKSRVCEVMGVSVGEVVFAPAGSIPKTYSGKRQRSLTKKRFLKGTLGRRSRWAVGRVLARAAVGMAMVLSAGLLRSAA
jgi:fatty-acyl-CoA synthase